ncbi:FAD-dependent monooxygenase [Blastococcus sp. PRF04-17]|uniref:FAD-dependent monooxygenase n=1 Tax=Blastococcus sp. PRF04-17 TaxID=2933797 RepID=UPI001FF0ED7B|nr:FAD-dependent monooxygenase [Blastococcus sp. PRF04-17]UOY01362.1 FAD-dependent monooxygenase [Blastococcus sp. PRF04-17]
MVDRRVPVLVVGGSLVGLSTSLLLASYGVPHLLVERHRGTAVHPRAASFHQRTMEVFRSVGLQPVVESAAEKEFEQNGAIVSVPSLSSPDVKYFFRHFNEGVEQLSPTARLFITQIGLEPLLRNTAEERGAEHRYGTELVGVEQDDDGVTAVIRGREDGKEETVRADYLVAADGSHSVVRRLVGIESAGRGGFADCVTIYFRADMRELIGDRNLSVVYVSHPELLGFFRFSITGDSGFLAVFSTTEPDGTRDTHVAQDMDTARCIALVRKALGRPDIEVEVDNVQRWTAAASWASRFQDRRIFLAGDAAHVMPPTGGFGGNTGVADAHNLAWKLAMVLDGTAGPGLLDTYDAERRPISSLIVEQAYTRYVLRVDPSLPQDDLAPPMDDASIELGPVHRSAAVLDPDDDGAPLVDPRQPGGRPGTRAPHLVVEADGTATSLLDVFGRGLVLLAGPGGQAWCDAAGRVAADLAVPLSAHRVAGDGPLVDRGNAFPELYGTGTDGAVVVRPDGVVAWRATSAAEDPYRELETVLRVVLMR